METCVLIPEELSLVLQAKPRPRTRPPGSSLPRNGDGRPPPLIPEMGAALWANRTLAPGDILRPDEGEMRLDKLEIYTSLESQDVRRKFGCHDDILEVEGVEVRHCNWVRFVASSHDQDSVNTVAIQKDGEVVFHVIKEIQPNEEIVVYFDGAEALTAEPKEEKVDAEPLKRLSDEFSVPTPQDDEGSSEMETTMESPSDVSSCHSSVETSPLVANTSASSNKEEGTPENKSTSSDQRTPSCERYTVWTGFSPQTGTPAPCTPHKFAREIELKMLQGPLRRKEKTWLPCDVCGKKFDRPSLLKRHIRTHTGEKPHACDICGKAFSTSSSLNTHRRIHSGEKPHQCQICGKRFTASSNLYYHRMTHKKEKPHKCNLCSKSFPTPGDLKSHMYVHNGSWPYKCDVCNRGFSKQTNLKNHMLLHSGDKPHECPLCHKKFALQCNLRTHLKTHEGEGSREDRCISCSQPLGTVVPEGSPPNLCSSCLNKPTPIKPMTRFSIDSLVSPDHPTKGHLVSSGALRPFSLTTSPSDIPKPPFYASAMMSAVTYGSVGPPHYALPVSAWPERPVPQRFGV